MKKRPSLFLVLLITMSVNSLVAQTLKSDSLLEVFKRDTTNFDVLIALAKSLVDVDNKQAILFAMKAKQIARQKRDTADIVSASRVMGQLYNRLGDVEMAIKELAPLLSVAERMHFDDEVKMILNSLAIAFMYTAQYDKALECHFKSLVLREIENNKKDISVTLNNIGAVYMQVSNNEQALIYLNKCLKVKEEIGDRFDLNRLYANLAACYSGIGEYEKADSYFAKALKECQPNCPKAFLMFLECSKGESYGNRKQFMKSRNAYDTSLQLAIADGHSQYHFLSLNGLARIAFDQGDLPTAETWLNRIERLSRKEAFPDQLQLFYSLSSDYYSQVGNFKKAFLFQKKYSEITKQINSSNVNRRISEVQLRFAERENYQKIKDQQSLLANQNAVIVKQKIINVLVGGLAGVTVLLIVVLFKMNQRKAEVNKILDLLVKDRTVELEKNSLALQRAFNEQRTILERVSRDLISSLATIRGLKHIAALENYVDAELYLRGAESTLFKSIRMIQGNADSDHAHGG